MPIVTTHWADTTFTTTHWPTFPDQDDTDFTWDLATDTWDNAADTWDALFASGSDSNPVPTHWADTTAPANTAWTTDL